MKNLVNIIKMAQFRLCIVFLVLITGFSFFSCDNSGGSGGAGRNKNTEKESMSSDTAMQYFRKNGIVAGWNLGNSLDAVRNWETPVIALEDAWSNPFVTQALLNGVKSQGFNIVRIPITWIGHIGPAPDYKLSAERLERTATVVNYAKNAGLKVIINIHHDDSLDDGWFLIGKAIASQTAKTQISACYGRLWTQVAERFKDCGDWLIFESMNEVQDGEWGWSDSFRANPKAQIDIINEWNQLFTDNVRKTGSNNAARYLMYPSYASNPLSILPDGRYEGGAGDVGKYFKLPKDRTAGRQIVTFHYYEPGDFALNGKDTDWDTTAFRNEVDNIFSRFKQHYIDKNIPVVIGEIGPCRYSGTSPAQIAAAAENRLKWIEFVFGKAKEYGLVPVRWDNGRFTAGNGEDQFGLFNRNNGQPNSEESRNIIKAMMSAVK